MSWLAWNRLASAQLGTAIATEGAATRAASANDRQIIMDKLCQLEMDGIKRDYEARIAGLQNQIDALRTANQDAKNQSYFNSLGDRFSQQHCWNWLSMLKNCCISAIWLASCVL